MRRGQALCDRVRVKGCPRGAKTYKLNSRVANVSQAPRSSVHRATERLGGLREDTDTVLHHCSALSSCIRCRGNE
jgi:hypothetical protein